MHCSHDNSATQIVSASPSASEQLPSTKNRETTSCFIEHPMAFSFLAISKAMLAERPLLRQFIIAGIFVHERWYWQSQWTIRNSEESEMEYDDYYSRLCWWGEKETTRIVSFFWRTYPYFFHLFWSVLLWVMDCICIGVICSSSITRTLFVSLFVLNSN